VVSVAITTIEDMVAHCRLRLDDMSPDCNEDEFLWKTTELQHFANEAIREVAIRTRCLRDVSKTTVGVTNYPITAPENTISIDDRILTIKRVWWNDVVLVPESTLFLDQANDPWRSSSNWRTDTTDEPKQFTMDLAGRELSLVGIPTADGVIKLDVTRIPLDGALEIGTPEIPQQFLTDCLDWMCHLAYLKNDADTSNPAQAASYAGEFERKVGPRPHDQRLGMEARQSGRRRSRLYYY
jgi:hypothetical protein